MEILPKTIELGFILTTLATLFIFYWCHNSSQNNSSNKKPILILLALIMWLGIQGFLSANHFYLNNTDSIPPNIFLFGVLPMILIMTWLFSSRVGKKYLDSLDPKKLTYLHLIRIPVELILYALFTYGYIPHILTFTGWNFDILVGLSAPLIIYYGFTQKLLSRKFLITWNIIGIILLLFVFALAVLSSQSPLQVLAFDQPNVGLLLFPFSWLPTLIVPIVIFSHMATIRSLYQSN